MAARFRFRAKRIQPKGQSVSEIDLTSPEVKQAIADAVAEQTAGLVAKRDELLGKIKKLQQGQQIDPADLAAVEAERDELKAKLAAADKAAKKTAADLEAATKRAAEIDTAYANTLRDSALTDALAKAGVTSPALLKAAKALLKDGVQVVDVDGKRVVKAGDVDLEKHITEWAGSDEGKHFVAAPEHNGGGSQGGRGSNETGNKLPDPTDKAGRAAVFAQRLAAASPEE